MYVVICRKTCESLISSEHIPKAFHIAYLAHDWNDAHSVMRDMDCKEQHYILQLDHSCNTGS